MRLPKVHLNFEGHPACHYGPRRGRTYALSTTQQEVTCEICRREFMPNHAAEESARVAKEWQAMAGWMTTKAGLDLTKPDDRTTLRGRVDDRTASMKLGKINEHAMLLGGKPRKSCFEARREIAKQIITYSTMAKPATVSTP